MADNNRAQPGKNSSDRILEAKSLTLFTIASQQQQQQQQQQHYPDCGASEDHAPAVQPPLHHRQAELEGPPPLRSPAPQSAPSAPQNQPTTNEHA
jgi:hypothetical protein